MLIFPFRKEKVGENVVLRPRFYVQLATRSRAVAVSALLDSGADRTIIPGGFARVLQLKPGKPISTTGIGGISEGYESTINLIFADLQGNEETMKNVPIYIVPGFNDVIIGRAQVFEEFCVTFQQYDNKIILERH